MAPSDRSSGTVATWLNHKGIGFITRDDAEEGDPDVLVHYESIKQDTNDGFRSLNRGSKVEFELSDDPKDSSRKVAINVTGPDGGECEPKQRSKGKGKKGKGKKGKGKKGKKGRGKKGKGKGKGGDSDEDEEEEDSDNEE